MPLTLQGRYYNVEEAASVTGYTIGRLHQLARAGELSVVHVNDRALLIPEAEVNRLKTFKATTGRPRNGVR